MTIIQAEYYGCMHSVYHAGSELLYRQAKVIFDDRERDAAFMEWLDWCDLADRHLERLRRQ